ncbi:hypothetical protein BDQ12DRAFT_669103 [Crucibulum laeve]|uniref:Uncharacterized protein n=1 Tax=Crucibulum laeve TaxID=68775 RepID=A0A5C3LSM4_9AGAR|nr:hypothetical protein BDQ12DRAFT_669103 [Crucibulum laeve]
MILQRDSGRIFKPGWTEINSSNIEEVKPSEYRKKYSTNVRHHKFVVASSVGTISYMSDMRYYIVLGLKLYSLQRGAAWCFVVGALLPILAGARTEYTGRTMLVKYGSQHCGVLEDSQNFGNSGLNGYIGILTSAKSDIEKETFQRLGKRVDQREKKHIL